MRLAVWREAHDFELVAELVEAQILSDRQIKQAQRMREECPLQNFEPRTAADRRGRADKIPKAVNRAHGGVFEWRHEKRACQVCRVVLNPMDARLLVLGPDTEDICDCRGNRCDVPVIRRSVAQQPDAWTMTQSKPCLSVQVRTRIPRHRDMIDLATADSGHLETRTNRLARKTGDVLDAAKALFFDRCDELAV